MFIAYQVRARTLDVYTAETENGRLGTLGGDKLNR